MWWFCFCSDIYDSLDHLCGTEEGLSLFTIGCEVDLLKTLPYSSCFSANSAAQNRSWPCALIDKVIVQ